MENVITPIEDEDIYKDTGVDDIVEGLESTYPKKTLETHLQEVDYSYLNSDKFKASSFAHRFINITKLINANSKMNKTPPVHLQMIDKLNNGSRYIANLCHRGLAKTTTFGENLIFYTAIFNELPSIPNIDGIIFVGDSMENGVKSLRRNLQSRYNESEFLKKYLPEKKIKWTDAYIEFENIDGVRTGVRLIGAKSGIRGLRILGRRPQLAILDDLVDDEDARSPIALESIRNTIYNSVIPALDPNIGASGVIANGTPFNKFDPVVAMIESGEWDSNVYPVCERFPCTREEFRGSWEDRFSYDYVLATYKLMKGSGKLNAFYQEYMLQITSEEERLIQEEEIQWYQRNYILSRMNNYNFYITSDFATSLKQTADYSVISVWAVDFKGNWYWVDGLCEKNTVDVIVDRLFEMVQKYQPLGVGLEAAGQQGGIISMIQRQMMTRGIWFNIIKDGASVGIRPKGDKLSRFNSVLPLFKLGKIFFPKELKNSKTMIEFMDEVRLATMSGLKGRDDFLDTISMLNYIQPALPSEPGKDDNQDDGYVDIFGEYRPRERSTGNSSYVV